MRCDQVTRHLDDLLDGTLQHSVEVPLLNHIAQCKACHGAWREARSFQRYLRHYSVPEMPGGMAERLLDKAQGGRQVALPGMAYGWAASVVMLIAGALIWSLLSTVGVGPEPVPVVVIEQQRNVQLVFNAPATISPAEFVIHLPDGVQLAGFEGEQTVRWQGQLAQGRNLLELPLTATAGATGEVVAIIEHADERKRFTLWIEGRGMPRSALESKGSMT